MVKRDGQKVDFDRFGDLGSHLSAGISDLGKDKTAAVAFTGLVVAIVVVIVLMAVAPSVGIRDLIGGSGVTSSSIARPAMNSSATSTSASDEVDYVFDSQDRETVEYLLADFAQGAFQSSISVSKGEELLLALTSEERTSVIYCTVNHPLDNLDVYPTAAGGSYILAQSDADKRSADLFGSDDSTFKPAGSYSNVIIRNGSDWLFGRADGGAWYEASVGNAVYEAGAIAFDCLIAEEYDVGGVGSISYWTVSLEPDSQNDFGYRVISMVKTDRDPTSHVSKCDTNIIVDEYNMPGRAVDGDLGTIWYGIVEDSEDTELTVALNSPQRLFGIAVSPGAYEATASGGDMEFDVLNSSGNSLGSLYASYYDYLDDGYYLLLFEEPIESSSSTLVVKSTSVEFGADSEFLGQFAPVAEIKLL